MTLLYCMHVHCVFGPICHHIVAEKGFARYIGQLCRFEWPQRVPLPCAETGENVERWASGGTAASPALRTGSIQGMTDAELQSMLDEFIPGGRGVPEGSSPRWSDALRGGAIFSAAVGKFVDGPTAAATANQGVDDGADDDGACRAVVAP